MAELKTKPTKASARVFIGKIADERKRSDALKLLEIFESITNEKPVMWGSSIIGFGSYHYKSSRSSQEGDWPLTGFSPRAQNFSLYIMSGFRSGQYADLLAKLGPHKHSVACLYIKRLDQIHLPTLKKLIKISVADMKKRGSNAGC